MPEWPERTRQYRATLECIRATRATLRSDVIPAYLSHPPATDPTYYVFMELDNAVTLWERDTVTLSEALLLVGRVVRQAVAEYDGFEVRGCALCSAYGTGGGIGRV